MYDIVINVDGRKHRRVMPVIPRAGEYLTLYGDGHALLRVRSVNNTEDATGRQGWLYILDCEIP